LPDNKAITRRDAPSAMSSPLIVEVVVVVDHRVVVVIVVLTVIRGLVVVVVLVALPAREEVCVCYRKPVANMIQQETGEE